MPDKSEKVRLRTEFREIYNDISSKISKVPAKEILFGSGLLLLTALTFYNILQIKKLNSNLIIENTENQNNENLIEEEKGLTLLILKEEQKEYNFDKFLKAHPSLDDRIIRLVNQGVDECKKIWPVDPLLYLLLIKHESNFIDSAVSPVGASGIVQLMPTTARDIGQFKGWKVFLPDYYFKGLHLNSKAIEYKSLSRIYFDNKKDELAKHYRELSEIYRKEADSILKKYKKNLLDSTRNKTPEELIKIHWPFNDSLAIIEGTKHFANLLAERHGDIREALAAYNAGLGSVEKASGIPFIYETFRYQNNIINEFKRWSKKLEIKQKSSPSNLPSLKSIIPYHSLYPLPQELLQKEKSLGLGLESQFKID